MKRVEYEALINLVFDLEGRDWQKSIPAPFWDHVHIVALANREARKRGHENWQDALDDEGNVK